MYLNYLKLHNIRCFQNAKLDLSSPDPEQDLSNITLILGNNGLGKTTILRAAALAVLTPIIHDSGYRPYRMIRQGAKKGTITGSLLLEPRDGMSGTYNYVTELGFEQVGDTETMKTPLKPNNLKEVDTPEELAMRDHYYRENDSAFFLVGYGATRRMEHGDFKPSAYKSEMMQRYLQVLSLFRDDVALLPLSAWLPDLKKDRKKEALDLLNRFFPYDDHQLLAEMQDGEFLFQTSKKRIPFSALSDGYRALIAWVSDLLARLCARVSAGQKLTDLPGVVLVDEVDLHLHPSWQSEILQKISATFPRLQFILSSHSPIIAGGLPAKHIFMTQQNEETGGVELKQGTEEIQGRSAEQILLSPYFGLKSTRAPGMRRDLEELSRRAEAGDEQAALEYLKLAAQGME